MSKIIPFKALLPNIKLAGRIVSPPYDVLSDDEARELAKDPYSFLHITRAEVDMPKDMSPYDDKIYAKARETFERFQSDGTFSRDETSFYIYRQIMGDHIQTGLVCLVPVEDYVNGKIKKHELTREEKLVDRTRHANEISAYVEPVFLVHRSNKKITALISAEAAERPLFEVTDHYGVRNILWRAKRANEISAAFSELDALYIADGHHRSAAAARVKELRQDCGGWNHFPVVIFPDNEVKIFEYKWSGEPSKRPLSKYSMSDIMKLADGGGIMPPKSTWFAPKLASGLFVHTF